MCMWQPHCDGSLSRLRSAAADGTQQASLDLQGNGTMQFLGSDISPLTLSIENIDQNILRVKLGANGRFDIPASLFQNTGQGNAPLFNYWCTLLRDTALCSFQLHLLHCSNWLRPFMSEALLCLQGGCRGILSMACSTALCLLALLSLVWG